ncbi:hypothetical protein L0U85_01700 [Glycomyces sp. L485]|uniref:hypothetical protein n=1 Tax=Glycomyces sp. L485 TaxID=2909235 RepID=UPI001F4A4BAF|nr:hypothetical protein [Glycomyces sp. L485]MCH7229582.1 hypothetical protein [Glycomyces sp. L485]
MSRPRVYLVVLIAIAVLLASIVATGSFLPVERFILKADQDDIEFATVDQFRDSGESEDLAIELLRTLDSLGMQYDLEAFRAAELRADGSEHHRLIMIWPTILSPTSVTAEWKVGAGAGSDSLDISVSRSGDSDSNTCMAAWYSAVYATDQMHRVISCTTQIVDDGAVAVVREASVREAVKTVEGQVLTTDFEIATVSADSRDTGLWGPNYGPGEQRNMQANINESGECASGATSFIYPTLPEAPSSERLLVPAARCVVVADSFGVGDGFTPGMVAKSQPMWSLPQEWLAVGGAFNYTGNPGQYPIWYDSLSVAHSRCLLPLNAMC